jgi:uncharacterized membrane protein (DUF106 family)
MDISARDALISGFLEIIIFQLYAQNAKAHIIIKGEKMEKIDKQKLEILAQLIEAMNDALGKLEKSYDKKDIEKFNESKKSLLDFQTKVAGILK